MSSRWDRQVPHYQYHFIDEKTDAERLRDFPKSASSLVTEQEAGLWPPDTERNSCLHPLFLASEGAKSQPLATNLLLLEHVAGRGQLARCSTALSHFAFVKMIGKEQLWCHRVIWLLLGHCLEPQQTGRVHRGNLPRSNHTFCFLPLTLPPRMPCAHTSVCERAAQVPLPPGPALFSAWYPRRPLRAHQQRSSKGQGEDCKFLDNPTPHLCPRPPSSSEPQHCRGPNQRPSTALQRLSPSVGLVKFSTVPLFSASLSYYKNFNIIHNYKVQSIWHLSSLPQKFSMF